jgi:hypothetical protein
MFLGGLVELFALWDMHGQNENSYVCIVENKTSRKGKIILHHAYLALSPSQSLSVRGIGVIYVYVFV